MTQHKITSLYPARRRRYTWAWDRTAWPLKAIMWILAFLPSAILALWITGLIDPTVPW